MRLRIRAAGFVALAIVAITCTDAPTGIRSGATAAMRHLQMAPSFTPEAARVYNTLAQAFGIDVTEVHVHLVGTDGTARDTVIAFPVGSDTLVLNIPVPAGAENEQFNALIELRNDAHTVLFSGTQTVTAHSANLPGVTAPVVTINYSGPGKGTRTISITPADTTAGATATLNYSATAIDSGGKAVTNLLVRWSVSDPTLATASQLANAAASISGTGKRGTVTVTATTPQGVFGTARLVLVPAPAKVVAISGGGQTASAGSVLPQPLVVEVQATDNLPVPGATVTFSAVTAGGAVQNATVVADANGRASTQLTLGKTAGTYQFMASSGSLTPATVTETATQAPASAIAVVSGDAQADSTGQKLALPLVVKVTDQFGGVVGGATVTWTRTAGSGAVANATTTTASGGTSNNSYTLGTVAGPDVIRASVAGVSTPAVFSATTIARGAASVTIVQGGAQTGTAGSALPVALVAQVKDAIGNPVGGATVAWSVAPAGVTFAPASGATNAAGQASTTATLGTTSGAYTVTAASGTLSATTTLTATAGSAASITKVAGDGQSATVGTAVAIAPSVVVKDANGNVVSGAAVTFAVASGAGNVTAATTSTNASGVATVGSWTLGAAAGANTLTATSGALTATFSATGTAASATKLTLLQGLPTSITVGAVFTTPVTVQIADANGNPVSQGGVTVTATANVQPANITQSVTATSNAAGVATFTIPPYVGPVGVVTFTASATGLTSVSSGQIPIVAGPAARLLLAAQPSAAATLGVNFAAQPSVQLADVFGNAVAAAGVSVTATIASGGGTLGGTVTVATNASGLASYTDLSISGAAGTRTLQFSSGALTAVVSNAIAVSVGAPASITKTAGDNQTASAGSAVTVAPSVVVKDASGNVVPGVTVTFAVASGGGGITGATATTDASGAASVGSWTLGSAAGANTLTATAGTASVTFTATGVAAAGAKIIPVSGLPTSITVGVPSSAPFIVRIADALGNPVAQPGVLVVLTGTLTPGNITGPLASATTDATGAATFSIPTYNGAVGSFIVTASASGLASFTSGVIPVLTGAATQLVFTTAPSSTVTSGQVLAQQPVVQIADAGGNPVSAAGVDVSASSATATIGGTTIVKTNASGVATFTNLDVTSTNSPITLVFSSGSLTPASASVTVTSSTGSLVFVGGWNPGPTVAFKPFNPQPKIQLLDQSGNPVRQANITVVAGIFAANPGGGSQNIQNPSVFTDAQGIATFTNLIIGGNPGTYTMQFLAGNTASGLTFPPLRFDVPLTAGGPTSISNNGFTNGGQTTYGTNTAQVPSVRVTDQFGSPVAGVNVVWSLPQGGQLITAGSTSSSTSLTVATDAAGVSALTAWQIGNSITPYTVQASVSGLSGSPVNFTTNSVAGPVAGLFAGTTLTGITVGATIPSFSVRLADVAGHPVAQAGVTVTVRVNVSPSGAVINGTAITDAAGFATFSLSPYVGQIGTGQVTFFSTGLASLGTQNIPIVAGAANGLLVVTQPSSAVTSGVAFPVQPAVRVIDVGSNAVAAANQPITAFIINGSGTLSGTAIVNTNATGLATFSGLAITGSGVHQLQFVAASANPPINAANANAMTVNGASGIAITAGNGQTGAVTSTLPVAPTIKVADANGVGVPNVSVTFTPRNGSAANGSISPVTVTTNGSGLAAVTWQLGQTAGALADTMDVTSAGLSGSPLRFTASGTPLAYNGLSFAQQPPASVQSGAVVTPAIVMQTVDRYGNTTATAGVTVTALSQVGSYTTSGTTQVVTDATGKATFSNLILTGTAGIYLLSMSDGANSFTSSNFTLAAGTATQLGFITPWTPGSTGAGVAFATQPLLQLLDASGNAVGQSGVTITAVVFSISGQVTLPITIQNNTAVTNVNGIAQFSGLVVGGNAANWVLRFSAPGTSGLNSGTLQIVAGPAATVAVNAGNGQTATAGATVATAPSVLVVDGSGNPVGGASVVWTANGGSSITNLTGTNGTTFTIPTNASGISSVGSWRMGSTVQGYTLTAASGSLGGSPVTFSATATAGSVTGLRFIQQPTTSVGGAVISPTVQVALVDVNGNTTTSLGATITLALTSGTGTAGASLTSPPSLTTVTNNGIATFPNLSVDISGNNYTITASTSALTAQGAPVPTQVSAAFNVTPGQFGLITTKASTRQSVDAAGTSIASTQPVFVVRNAAGTLLQGTSVKITANGHCFINNGNFNGPTFTYASDAIGEVKPSIRLPASASVGGGCSVIASAPALTAAYDTSLYAFYPSGTTHVWMGTASTNWSNSSNWVRPGQSAAVPSSPSDQVFIPVFAGVTGNRPALNGVLHPVMARLALDTNAFVQLNSNILDVGTTVGASGVSGFGFILNGTTRLIANGTLNGIFDKLEIGVNGGACSNMMGALATVTASQLDLYCAARVDTVASVSTDLVVHPSGGGLTIANNSAGLTVNGNALFTGDSLVAQGGVISVNGAATFGGITVSTNSGTAISVNGAATFAARQATYNNAALVLQGKATFGGTGAGAQQFFGGVMTLLGDFAQIAGTVVGVPSTFTTASDHILRFFGTSAQAISFVTNTNSLSRVQFGNTSATGVTLNSSIGNVNGTSQPRFFLSSGKLTLGTGVNFTDSGNIVFGSGTTLNLSSGSNLGFSNGTCSGHNGMTINGPGTIGGQVVTAFTCP